MSQVPSREVCVFKVEKFVRLMIATVTYVGFYTWQVPQIIGIICIY